MFSSSIFKLSWLEGIYKSCFVFKCDKDEHAADYQQQYSSKEKENEETVGTSDDIELVIHCALRGFHEYQKIWSQKFEQKTEH